MSINVTWNPHPGVSIALKDRPLAGRSTKDCTIRTVSGLCILLPEGFNTRTRKWYPACFCNHCGSIFYGEDGPEMYPQYCPGCWNAGNRTPKAAVLPRQ
jgi:hypothetical protein